MKKFIDEPIIINLYVNESFSGREISKKTGHALTTIQRILKKNNITRNLKEARANLIKKGYKHPLRKELDKNKIIDLYVKENISIPKIAKMFDCSLDPILRILRENKIPTKSSSESHKGKPSFWKGKNEKERMLISKKISESRKGIKFSEAHLENLKKSHIGKKSLVKGKRYEEIHGEEKAKELKENALKRRLKQFFPTKNTAPERILFNELEIKGIIFEKHKTLFNKFQPDAVISEKKIAIFVDGDYWHANPIKYKNKVPTKSQFDRVKRDKEQNEILKNNNWIILRFWESEIKKDVKKCVDMVEKTISQTR